MLYSLNAYLIICLISVQWKACDFLCVNNGNLPRILHRFRDIADYWCNFRGRQEVPVFNTLIRG